MKWKPGPQSYSRFFRHSIVSTTRCSFPGLSLASNWKECRKECYGKFGCLPSVMQVQLIFYGVHLVLSPYGAGHPPCLLHNHSVRSNWFREPAMATSSTMKGLWALEIAIFQGFWHISFLEIILVTAVQVTLGRQAESISNARLLYGQRYQVIQWGWQPMRMVTLSSLYTSRTHNPQWWSFLESLFFPCSVKGWCPLPSR